MLQCDSRTPSCTRCLQAGAVCVGIDRVTAAPLPRRCVTAEYQHALLGTLALTPRLSIIQHLQNEITAMEAELCLNTQVSSSRTAQPSFPFQRDVYGFLSRITSELSSAEEDRSLGILLASSLSTSSSLPKLSPGELDSRNEIGLTSSNYGDAVPLELEAVPKHVADVLIRVYVDKILPQYPFLQASQINAQYGTVYNSPPRHVSRFIIAMVMAISTMTSGSVEIDKVMAFSDALFRSAIARYEYLPTNSLETLQCTMLVFQFANFRPGTANVWAAKETAIKMAIALGLHKQPDPAWHALDQETLQLRARVFWVVSQILVILAS